jgi:outer membrane protein, multidrug efflux system
MPARWSGQVSETEVDTQASVADLRWWEALKDPVLNSLVRIALDNNGDLKVAMARVDEARGQRLDAQSALFPHVGNHLNDMRGNAGTNTVNRNAALFDAGFDASWEIDIFGGNRCALEAPHATVQSKQASLRQARVSLLAELVRTYLDYLRIER